MPKFTPEKEMTILEAYNRTPNYAAVGRELNVDQKAVKNAVERFRKRQITKTASLPMKDPPRQDEVETSPAMDETKRMYKLFLNGRRPVLMITEDGFNSVDVQNEHDRFQKLEGLEPHFMQEKLIKRLAMLVPAQGKSKERFELLKHEFDSNHFLNGTQFDDLLSILVRVIHHNGLNSTREALMPAPDGWQKPKCVKCGEVLSGLVFDPTTRWGTEIARIGSNWVHAKCPTEG